MLGIVLGSTMAITVQLGCVDGFRLSCIRSIEMNVNRFLMLIGTKMIWDLPMVFCLFMESVPVLRGI